MKTVNIAELKSRLSAYIDEVRGGAELVIRDRTKPVAMLVPLTRGTDLDAEERQLVAEGRLRPALAALGPEFDRLPAPRVSRARAVAAVSRERDED